MGVLVIRGEQDYAEGGGMESANPTVTYDAGSYMIVGNEKSNVFKGIVEWDLRGLTWARPIVAAQLELYAITITGAGTGTDRARRMRRHTGSATPWDKAYACWNNYANGSAWAAAGATDTTNDVDTTDSFSWTAPTAAGWFTACPFSTTSLLNLINDAFNNRGGYLALLFELSSHSGLLRSTQRTVNLKSDAATFSESSKLTLVFEQAQAAQLWVPGGMVVV